jgi:hypothetical protein
LRDYLEPSRHASVILVSWARRNLAETMGYERCPIGRALEFLLLALEKRKFETGTMARYPLPNMAWPMRAFSMPRTNSHDIIPNFLSMFKSEHYEADRGNLRAGLTVICKKRPVARMATIHAHRAPTRDAACRARTNRDLSRTARSIARASATDSGSCATPSASAELQACSTIWAIS